VADAPDLPGCSVSGWTIDEAPTRLREAVAAYVKDGQEYELVEEISW
jgi:predicted RNase H-like HicB family nuclease